MIYGTAPGMLKSIAFLRLWLIAPTHQFLLRVGYEVSLLLFAYNGNQYVC